MLSLTMVAHPREIWSFCCYLGPCCLLLSLCLLFTRMCKSHQPQSSPSCRRHGEVTVAWAQVLGHSRQLSCISPPSSVSVSLRLRGAHTDSFLCCHFLCLWLAEPLWALWLKTVFGLLFLVKQISSICKKQWLFEDFMILFMNFFLELLTILYKNQQKTLV